MTKDRVLTILYKWADGGFKEVEELKAKILFTDSETGEIICQGKEYMVFSDKLLVLERTVVSYQVF